MHKRTFDVFLIAIFATTLGILTLQDHHTTYAQIVPNNTNSNNTTTSSASHTPLSNSIINETNTKTTSAASSVKTTMLLLDDAIQALREKNPDKALVHLDLVRQNLASLLSSTASSSPHSNKTTSTNSQTGASKLLTDGCKTLSALTTAGTKSSAKSPAVQQAPSVASDFKNHDPCTIRVDFVKVGNMNLGGGMTDYEMKGELTNTGKQTLNGLRIHIHWYDQGMNVIGFNNGQNGVYSPSDTVVPGQSISFDFLQNANNDFTGLPAFFKLSYDWH